MRILVVEDETLVREHMRVILEDAGHVVAEAGSADEALLLLEDYLAQLQAGGTPDRSRLGDLLRTVSVEANGCAGLLVAIA